ncbi:MarR family winged helix-turn-helix transcriptional regulator [Chitinasiproducens palmae]|uniref:DNA-binding transcriptional regulator, MarR family n=1 Tax=Chitinasiproducens palmae TaxID=1770053 RepID=A0A1H2PM96_9BURK|nr:MarR family transcriptional regulator [Chitinasiproducens palmae]SDV47618.1 DNA-binding transcriptional regulator, MarR family [Chitinasiproducens palmae]
MSDDDRADADAPGAPARYAADESLGYLLARVRSALSTSVHRRASVELGLSGKQAIALKLIHSGRCTAAEIAREYGLEASAVTRLLDRLEDGGLVTRERSVADRRVVELSLTVKGEEVESRVRTIINDALEQMMTGFTFDEGKFLQALLKRMLANSQAANQCRPETGEGDCLDSC